MERLEEMRENAIKTMTNSDDVHEVLRLQGEVRAFDKALCLPALMEIETEQGTTGSDDGSYPGS